MYGMGVRSSLPVRAETTEGPGTVKSPGLSSFLRVGDLVQPVASGLREAVRRERGLLEHAWVQFLSKYEWQWFATFTFKDATHPEAADKRYKFWCRLLDDSNGYKPKSKKTHKRRCVWVRGLEWQKRDVLHFHALIGNLPYELTARTRRDAWEQAWLLMGSTGFAHIREVAEVVGVAGYVSKYCAKGGDIDVSPNLAGSTPDLSGSVTAT